MNEVIKYFESIEARMAGYETRIATLEARIASLEETLATNEAVIASMEAEIEELRTRPQQAPELPIIDEPIIEDPIFEEPVTEEAPVVEEEPVVEEPAIEEEPVAEPEPVVEKEPKVEEEHKVEEEKPSPKAAIYGKAVDDIRMAISLGDRFLYQRELFGQNAELMQRTLTELNGLGSFDEAVAYISSHFQWDTESSTYQQFLVTLHRRFG